MPKLIQLLLLGFLVYLFLRIFSRPKTGPQPRSGPHAAVRKPEKMVACAHCHVHVPEGEALTVAGHHFCCEEHRRLGPE